MTETETLELSPNSLYEFNMYYGEKLYGSLEKDINNQWHVILRRSDSEKKTKILLSQIVNYKELERGQISIEKITSRQFTGNPRFRTLIIFGAGASYDYSFKKGIIRPPLGKDLFDNSYSEIISNFPGAENLSSQILVAKDIENYFQQQWDKIMNSYNPNLLNKLIDVQYYLHYLFQKFSENLDFGRNNYSSFMQSLRDDLIMKGDDEKALVVSFNYDTILEQSLTKAFNYNYNNLEDYIDYNKRFFLLKPHGSWNWVKSISPEFYNNLRITDNSRFSISKVIYQRNFSIGDINKYLSKDIQNFKEQDINLFYPQLLIPYKNKDSFVMPNEHADLLKYHISQVDKIIIIGWKGTEEVFKKILEEKLGNKELMVYYVNAKDETVEKELKTILKKAIFSEVAPYQESKGTFSELNEFIQEYPNKLFELVDNSQPVTPEIY